MASQFSGFIGGGGQVQLKRAARAGNGQLAPVIHRQAGHSRGPAFRDGKGVVDWRHENIGPNRHLNEVVGFLINNGIRAVWLNGCGHGIEGRCGARRAGLAGRIGKPGCGVGVNHVCGTPVQPSRFDHDTQYRDREYISEKQD